MSDTKTHGQVAYEAYREHAGFKSVHGEELPAWHEQMPGIRQHWEHAATAVVELHTDIEHHPNPGNLLHAVPHHEQHSEAAHGAGHHGPL